MQTYNEALAVLKNRDSKKLENNTYLVKKENALAVRLHQTDVVTYHSDGKVILNSGGWRTPTTKDRINTYSPVKLWQKSGVWYLTSGEMYQDGIEINPDGSNTGKKETDKDKKKLADLKKKLKKYSSEYVGALVTGKIPAPTAGDCWYCVMKTDDNKTLGEVSRSVDHLTSHLEKSYYVPSLLMRAMERIGTSIAAKQTAMAYMHNKPEYIYPGTWINKDLEKTLYRYLKIQFEIGG